MRPTRLLLLVLLGSALAAGGCDPLADDSYSGTVVVRGRAAVASSLTCGTDPMSDCKGALLVGLIDRPEPLGKSTLFGSTRIDRVDLSGGGQASYEIAGAPEGFYYISAMLAETTTLTDPPYPKTGDLAVAPQPLEVRRGTVAVHDIQLDIRWKQNPP